ncbi:hypothetical protein FWD07_01575 [Candidatus Saccharibacteria bacterium]|nr:hypothetical protein [Candidatus Saccharibacteria bacterium]
MAKKTTSKKKPASRGKAERKYKVMPKERDWRPLVVVFAIATGVFAAAAIYLIVMGAELIEKIDRIYATTQYANGSVVVDDEAEDNEYSEYNEDIDETEE